jgi:hypothetical protein
VTREAVIAHVVTTVNDCMATIEQMIGQVTERESMDERLGIVRLARSVALFRLDSLWSDIERGLQIVTAQLPADRAEELLTAAWRAELRESF